MKPPTNNLIALVSLLLAFGLTIFIFAESRNDPGLRMAALVSATGTVASLIAIASTMLTGKDLSHGAKDESGPTAVAQINVPTPPAEPAQKKGK